MASRMGTMALWSFSTKIGAGQGALNLLPAPPAQYTKTVVTFFKIHVITSAAQSADFTLGSVVVASLGVSEPLGDASYTGDLVRGIVGVANAALAYAPSAAGYALLVTAEGYYE
jgi:hypothetical protein